ncbi:o-succinylbenzoate--CoA ligase [Gordonia sp. CPCC 205515]|uniref:o-succinylbenzoate--CoA ligase n=1 Tax=Gordonia sp. CPCC 205515 TaxID=3140791 RepID=UPI003AF4026F
MLERIDVLQAALAGEVAFLPVPDESTEAARLSEALAVGAPIGDDISLVVSTSGTTGTPKGAQHTPNSLAASAQATHSYLGGDGIWLLALPPHHIAGLQVLLRSLRAGFTPSVLDLRDGFDPSVFARAVHDLDGPHRYSSLVPGQLLKALDAPDAVRALRELDGLLIGGAATPLPLQRRAADEGVPIVRTYGMSETAGGCVYDGVPLDGVTIRIDDPNPDGVGRVVLGGSVVAHGYRNQPQHPAFAEPGWFRTDDLGRVDEHGVLSIVGRADEAISSGGLTIVPQVVEAVIVEDPAVAECAVVGMPDERLGERVVAFVVAADGQHVNADRIRGAVAERLEKYAAPREVVVIDSLPLRGPGKVDRRALREQRA